MRLENNGFSFGDNDVVLYHSLLIAAYLAIVLYLLRNCAKRRKLSQCIIELLANSRGWQPIESYTCCGESPAYS